MYFSFLFYFEYIFLLANSENPENAASDLARHCFPMSQYGLISALSLVPPPHETRRDVEIVFVVFSV